MAPLITFYGDDFTGSTAAMEVLNFAGVPTMLFMEPPGPEVLKEYPNLQGIGIAGIARSKDPTWMKINLSKIFERLKSFKAPVSHYKVCSTFDSAPEIGSIGVAAELGFKVFNSDWIPMLVGAPAINRYQAFGNLFAGAGQSIYRLDKHPVMSRHPITPMDEADLGQHLAHQTNLRLGTINLASMKAGLSDKEIYRQLSDGVKILAIDVVDDETIAEAGRIIWPDDANQVFVVGSQGVEYALVAHWRKIKVIKRYTNAPKLSPVKQIFAVSGSCSPTTADQILAAKANGFKVLDFKAFKAIEPRCLAAELDYVYHKSLKYLSDGYDVLVTTAKGPNDPTIKLTTETIAKANVPPAVPNERLGGALGHLVSKIRRKTRMQRIVISGGDTSGHALTAVGVQALSAVAPIEPGAPLCQLHVPTDCRLNGLEVALKGGQMGTPSFFVRAKGGR